jgi:hypothetical protein
MELVAIVGALALLEYGVFVMLCGYKRGRAGVPAPATTGNAEFERYYRVQMNTVEQLVIFVPALPVFALYVSEMGAVALGCLFILGRAIYARGYVRDPAGRGPGFLMTLLANVVLVIGALVGALIHIL